MPSAITKDMRFESIIRREHDDTAVAKRVIPVSTMGKSISYEGSNFTSGDSPTIADVAIDASRSGKGGFISNDGTGKLLISISDDGLTFGGNHTLKPGDILDMTGLLINQLKLTWVANTKYRMMII